MTLEEVHEELTTIGIPVVFRQFEHDNAPDPPYIIFYDGDNLAFGADGINYFNRFELYIELYTDFKDTELEKKVEDFFNSHRFMFESEQMYWEDERLHEVLYRAVIF